jgi:hypothetical protein
MLVGSHFGGCRSFVPAPASGARSSEPRRHRRLPVSNLPGSRRVPLPRWRATRHCRVNTSSVAPFQAAPRFFADCVVAVPVERYGTSWSDEWSVLELIGHGNRANVLPVETTSDRSR